MKIVVKKGLDIPIAGKPEGSPQSLPLPQFIALNLDPFEDIRFKVHVKVGDQVKIGQPLVENKAAPAMMFVSPAAGIITEVRRGLKRRLLDIVIKLDDKEQYHEHERVDFRSASRESIVECFMRTGLFPHIRLRPFNLVPHPKFIPRDIFVNAIETRPFVPSPEMQLGGNEEFFQTGLDVLSKLTSGKVHLVHEEKSTFNAFIHAKGVEIHTASGPHPAGTSSLHIHRIAPVRKPDDYVWSLSAIDAAVIGKMFTEGKYLTSRLISIAGSGVMDGKRGFFNARMGYPIQDLIANRIPNELLRFISGDPLTGNKVEQEDFLGFFHNCFSIIPENTERQFLHFLRLGSDKFSATRAYLTGHVKPPVDGYAFTTNQHGEKRAFIDTAIYEKVMPMKIPTVHLVKAILAEDFELAQQLGLLEVVPEDFALPSFICPSKIEMIDIVKQGLNRFAKEMGH